MTAPILVGLALRDDDAAPLALARRLAQASGAPLVLVTVVAAEGPARVPAPEYFRAVHDDAARRLEAVAATLGDLHVTTLVREGSRAAVLHDLAEVEGAAAIVVGSTHRGTVGRLLIGDLGAGLLHGSSCPVAIAPRGYEQRAGDLRRIGVAFDGSPESEEALAAAAGLAGRAGAELAAYTVLEPLQTAVVHPVPGWVPPPPYDETRRRHARELADTALEHVPEGVHGTAAVLEGRAVDALAETSAGLDLLVCGSRGYGAVRSVMAGGVSRGLAHRAACPLLVVPRRPAPHATALWREAAVAAT